jgi:hypothetical protein
MVRLNADGSLHATQAWLWRHDDRAEKLDDGFFAAAGPCQTHWLAQFNRAV